MVSWLAKRLDTSWWRLLLLMPVGWKPGTCFFLLFIKTDGVPWFIKLL
jgi:hypothetical protein